jgi:hypothetical protein
MSFQYKISSKYVNGWTIYQGLKLLPSDHISSDWLFCTEESTLQKALQNGVSLVKPFLDQRILDDKFAFHDFLLEIGELSVPSWNLDEINKVAYPIFLKSKHSWKKGKKMPRGWICYSNTMIASYLKLIDESDYWKREDFFLQSFLGATTQNISVSGYFDYSQPKRNLTIVTQKTIGDKPFISTGIIVESIPDPDYLIPRTFRILNHLKYDGPYELEYLFNVNKNHYLVLELNPRFWMQHGIFLAFYDNGLLKRYLNLDTPNDYQHDLNYQHVGWASSIGILIDMMKGDFRALQIYLKMKKEKISVYIAPDILTALRVLPILIVNKIFGLNLKVDLF